MKELLALALVLMSVGSPMVWTYDTQSDIRDIETTENDTFVAGQYDLLQRLDRQGNVTSDYDTTQNGTDYEKIWVENETLYAFTHERVLIHVNLTSDNKTVVDSQWRDSSLGIDSEVYNGTLYAIQVDTITAVNRTNIVWENTSSFFEDPSEVAVTKDIVWVMEEEGRVVTFNRTTGEQIGSFQSFSNNILGDDDGVYIANGSQISKISPSGIQWSRTTKDRITRAESVDDGIIVGTTDNITFLSEDTTQTTDKVPDSSQYYSGKISGMWSVNDYVYVNRDGNLVKIHQNGTVVGFMDGTDNVRFFGSNGYEDNRTEITVEEVREGSVIGITQGTIYSVESNFSQDYEDVRQIYGSAQNGWIFGLTGVQLATAGAGSLATVFLLVIFMKIKSLRSPGRVEWK